MLKKQPKYSHNTVYLLASCHDKGCLASWLR